MVDENQYLIALSEVLCPLAWDAPLDALSEPERVFVCVYDLEREVNNGGFDQYFRNASGAHGQEAVRALESLGAHTAAALLREAVEQAFRSGSIPAEQDARADIVEAGGEALVESLRVLDEKFYEYPDDLTHLLFLYVQENVASIRES